MYLIATLGLTADSITFLTSAVLAITSEFFGRFCLPRPRRSSRIGASTMTKKDS
jgi:hypothetical protein